MKIEHMLMIAAGGGLLLMGLSGCGSRDGQDVVAASPEIVEVIEARKVNYKEIGGAYKTIADEIKSGAPDLNTIGPMAQEIRTRAAGQLDYFVAGSGPESGEKTRAKAQIWRSLADFSAAHEKFLAAADRLIAAAKSGDVAAVSARYDELGAACKGCHDRFRERDE